MIRKSGCRFSGKDHAQKARLPGDLSEVTALGMRHWTTSFQLVDDGANVAASGPEVKAQLKAQVTNFTG
jgi:hypothetical protein